MVDREMIKRQVDSLPLALRDVWKVSQVLVKDRVLRRTSVGLLEQHSSSSQGSNQDKIRASIQDIYQDNSSSSGYVENVVITSLDNSYGP